MIPENDTIALSLFVLRIYRYYFYKQIPDHLWEAQCSKFKSTPIINTAKQDKNKERKR